MIWLWSRSSARISWRQREMKAAFAAFCVVRLVVWRVVFLVVIVFIFCLLSNSKNFELNGWVEFFLVSCSSARAPQLANFSDGHRMPIGKARHRQGRITVTHGRELAER